MYTIFLKIVIHHLQKYVHNIFGKVNRLFTTQNRHAQTRQSHEMCVGIQWQCCDVTLPDNLDQIASTTTRYATFINNQTYTIGRGYQNAESGGFFCPRERYSTQYEPRLNHILS